MLSKKDLGKLIKEARKYKSEKINKLYTQQMLANDIKKSQSYIGDLESGRTYPSFVLLNEIADTCGVPISFFRDNSSINNDIDNFIKMQLYDTEDTEVSKIREHLKKDPDVKINYIYDYIRNTDKKISELGGAAKHFFKTPEECVSFILEQNPMINFCGIDIKKLKKEDMYNLVEDILNQLKLISYKYKK